MQRNALVSLAVAAALVAAGGYGTYQFGVRRGMAVQAAPWALVVGAPDAAGSAAIEAVPQSIAKGEAATRRHITAGIKAGDVDPLTGKRVLYYHDPMVPATRFDQPGKSPFMDMMLVPVYADAGAANGGRADRETISLSGNLSGSGSVSVSPRMQHNLGVRTALVTEGSLSPQVDAVGSIAFNERDQAIVQARATGYVEQVQVRATLDRVAKGQPLAELYVPDWIAAQEEFLAVRRMQGTDQSLPDDLVAGARQRMRQVGMSEAQVALVERSGRTQPRMTLVAPIGGVVTELMARVGMTVAPGATLFRINGLSTVWANAEVPESQSAWLRPGTAVRATSPAVPGVGFVGQVQAIVPEVNPTTRTLKARVELANASGALVPGMFVQMQFTGLRGSKALLVPTEAIIQTGKRTLVMLAEAGAKAGDKVGQKTGDETGGETGEETGEETGNKPAAGGSRFRPVAVDIGSEVGGQTEVTRGLQLGQRVVVSAQFLIDSEASLKGVEARLNVEPAPPAVNASARHAGTARIEAIGTNTMTLSHGPIASLKWGAMTMEFSLPQAGNASGAPRNLKAGDRIDFEFYLNTEGAPQLTGVTLLPPEPKAARNPAQSKP